MASLALVFDLLAKDNASPAFRDVGNAAEKAGKQTSTFGALTAKAMASAAGAIAGIGIGALLGGAVRAASDLNETVNKTNVIFGQNAREIRSWAQGSARNFGLSEQAALAAASQFGNMLTQLGYTSDAAVDASTNTVKLAADLGSFNNLDTGDVLDRISAALRGEYDSLQLLIPNINAARVEQEALAATGKTTASALTAQEKATATLAIVQRDGAAAANDFAETSDGLANSQRILNAEWQDAQARLGQLLVGPMTGVVQFATSALIPAFEAIAGVVSGTVDLFSDLPGPIQAGVVALGAVVLLKGPLSSLFETIALRALYAKDAILATSVSAGALRSAGSGLLAFFGGPIGLAITGVTVGLGFLISALSDTEEATDGTVDAQNELTDALRASKGAIDANVRAAAAKELQDQGVLDTLEDMGIATSTATDAILGNGEALGRLGADLQSAINAGTDFHGVVTEEAQAAQDARNALYELAGQTEGSVAAASQLAAATAETGTAMSASAGQTAEASAALDEWLKKLQNISEGFVEPLSVYKDLLSEKQSAERESAEATAAATDSGEDSWEDYVETVEVSLQEYATALMEQITAQENWRTNLVTISQRGGAEVAQILAEMGVEGAQITAQMATATEEDFQTMRDALIREAQLAGSGATGALANELAVMALIGRDGSARTVQEVARQLNLGVDQVREIARQYGVELAAGVNPLLRGLGKPGIDISGAINSGGGRAMGGYIVGPGGPTEDKAGLFALSHGEYVVKAASVAKYGRKFMDDLNIGRLASGGFVSAGSVPKPPSLAPYQWPISPPGQATNERAYGDTVDWVNANAVAAALPPGVLGTPGQYQAMFAALKAVFPNAVLTSGFRPGSITATGNLSYHALGRAVDINPDAAMFNWIKSTYGSRIRELIFSPMGGQQVWNGQNHLYSEPTRGDHWDHIHWAMANGGVINEPVFGMGMRSGDTYSFGERGPETVTPGVHGPGGGSATYEGRLYLDSGQFLGVVRGTLVEQSRTQQRNLRSARGGGN